LSLKEYETAMDKLFPRMAEPDEEGIDLHPHDPRRRFIAVSAGATFEQADRLTEEEKAEANAMWEAMTGGNYSPEKKKNKKPEKIGHRYKEEGDEDLGDRHVANADGAIFYDADPLTEEDLAELAKLKKMLNIE
jgi:hypothetical protein